MNRGKLNFKHLDDSIDNIIVTCASSVGDFTIRYYNV